MFWMAKFTKDISLQNGFRSSLVDLARPSVFPASIKESFRVVVVMGLSTMFGNFGLIGRFRRPCGSSTVRISLSSRSRCDIAAGMRAHEVRILTSLK